MGDMEVAFTQILDSLSKICPEFQPAIFPFKINPKLIEDLLDSKTASNSQITEWIASLAMDLTQVAFTTKVNFSERTVEITEMKFVSELDFMLNSPEKVLSMLLQGSESEISIAVERFLELNGHEVSVAEGKAMFIEAYNSIYALRVLLSNIAGLQVVVGSQSIPLHDAENALNNLKPLIKIKTKKSKQALIKDSNENIDESNQNQNIEKHNSKHKKRRRAK